LAGHLDWPGLAQVCRLERTTRRNGKKTIEVEHAITSLAAPRADASRLLPFWREHWHIENRLHWVRDVTLGEDGCRVKLGHGPQNLAACRNAALNLLRLDGANGIAATLRHYASRPWELLKLIGILKN
jgi:predicted transposase YbfD/YdcC